VLSGNSGGSYSGIYGPGSLPSITLSHNLITDASDPFLGPLADNGGPTPTMALLPGSPAIDAGVPIAGVTTDQRGVARPQGTAPDIGAFESRGFTVAIASGVDQRAASGSNFPEPLTVHRGDRRRVRRALTPEEAARVIQAAQDGPKVQRMTGPDRAALDLTAIGTGLRAAKELRP
jgi:hypothetical protein